MATEIFQLLRRRFVLAPKDRYNRHVFGRFAREEVLGLREGRLLALSFPNVALELASALALNIQESRWDRAYAIHLLGYLAAAGKRDAESALVAAARDPTYDVSGLAIFELLQVDQQGKCRDLYASKCAERNGEAFDALSSWSNDANRTLMNNLVLRGESDPDNESLILAAKQVLERYAVLDSTELDSRLKQILRDPTSDPSLTRWALTQAKIRGMPDVKSVLRERLDAGFKNAILRFKQSPKDPRLSPQLPFEQRYPVIADPPELADPCHDDLLVAYSELGGELTKPEDERMRFFGYGPEPRQALDRLLATIRK